MVVGDVDEWEHVISVDLKGVFLSLKHEIAYVVANGGGSIINTASVAGVIGDPGMATTSPPSTASSA